MQSRIMLKTEADLLSNQTNADGGVFFIPEKSYTSTNLQMAPKDLRFGPKSVHSTDKHSHRATIIFNVTISVAKTPEKSLAALT